MKIEFLNGGRFISRGYGIHPCRKIDSYEIILVNRGRLSIYEEETDFLLEPGDWLLLEPGKQHGGLLKYPADLSFFWLHFHADAAPGAGKTGHAVRFERMAEYFNLLLAEQREMPEDKTGENLLLRLILHECGRYAVPPAEAPGLAAAAMNEIKTGFSGRLTRALLGEKLNCNADHLGRVFRNFYGESVTSAIKRTRLEYAARRLSESVDPVKSIIYDSGFNDPAYFRRSFFQLFGMTPHEYRRVESREIHLNTE